MIALLDLLVYVAGASREPERVRWAMNACEELGATVAHDWLEVIEQEGAANEGLDYASRIEASIDCMAGIAKADILWVLAPITESCGVWWELGYAYGKRDAPRIVISGPSDKCIFASGCIEFERDADVPDWIEREGVRILKDQLDVLLGATT